MHAWLDWLAALPAPWLYSVIAVAAFLENVFPPLPADTIVALGAFAAARGDGSATGAWVATMIGNIGGAMSMFALGRRVGIRWLTTRFPRVFPAEASAYVAVRFRERGMLALVVSRFLPGVRALVPPVAGAMGVAALGAAIAMTLASGVWYGLVCVLAFRAGANADVLLAAIARQQRLFAVVAIVVIVIVTATIARRRRRPS